MATKPLVIDRFPTDMPALALGDPNLNRHQRDVMIQAMRRAIHSQQEGEASISGKKFDAYEFDQTLSERGVEVSCPVRGVCSQVTAAVQDATVMVTAGKHGAPLRLTLRRGERMYLPVDGQGDLPVDVLDLDIMQKGDLAVHGVAHDEPSFRASYQLGVGGVPEYSWGVADENFSTHEADGIERARIDVIVKALSQSIMLAATYDRRKFAGWRHSVTEWDDFTQKVRFSR